MFTGSIVALVTPMDKQGKIDRFSLKKLVNYHICNGTTAIVAMGTTGETATMSFKEYYNIVMWILEFSNSNIPVIVGTGANSTAKAISLNDNFKNSGVAACLSITPYYNRPNQEGLFQHFKNIAENTNLPQILYNVPIRTGCDILPETVARLANIKNIIGIKEATGNLSRINQIKTLINNDFILLSGDDATALDFMQLGGVGVISVTANVAAKEMATLCKLANEGNFHAARHLNQRLMPLYLNLFSEPNPTPVKWACKKLGLMKTDTVRLPMISLSKNNACVIKQALVKAGLL